MTPLERWFTVAGTPHAPIEFVLLGLVVGYLSGLFGVGGGFMLTPLLNTLFAIPFDIAVGSGLCQMIGASTTAVLRYRQHEAVDFKLSLAIVGGSLLGVVAGARLVYALRALGTVEVGGHSFSLLRAAMDVLFLLLLLCIAFTIFTEEEHARRERAAAVAGRVRRGLLPPCFGPGPHEHFSVSRLRSASLPGLAYLGLAVGLLTGMLGVGGGVVLIPLLIYGLHVPTAAAIGTSLVLIFFSAVAGTTAHAVHGNVHLPIALALLLGSTVGAQLGALSALRLHSDRLRSWFGVLVIAAATLLARDLYQVVAG